MKVVKNENSDMATAAEQKTVQVSTEAVVHSAQGGHIRTYSKEVHGENFEELAKEFVAHTPGAVITVR